MSKSFDHLKDSEYEGVKGLADAAQEILKAAGPSQERGTVAEYPNERTIRYYMTEGLLPEPIEKRGVTSVFGYPHLLTLVAIKKLQADGLSINIIRQLIAGKSRSELEELLGGEVDIYAGSEQSMPTVYAMEEAPEIGEVFGEPAKKINQYDEIQVNSELQPEKNAATEYLEGLLFSRPARDDHSITFSRPQQSSLPNQVTPPAPRILKSVVGPPKAHPWRREEIAPGLEIHIRSDYKPPAGFREMRRLLQMVKDILRR